MTEEVIIDVTITSTGQPTVTLIVLDNSALTLRTVIKVDLEKIYYLGNSLVKIFNKIGIFTFQQLATIEHNKVGHSLKDQGASPVVVGKLPLIFENAKMLNEPIES